MHPLAPSTSCVILAPCQEAQLVSIEAGPKEDPELHLKLMFRIRWVNILTGDPGKSSWKLQGLEEWEGQLVSLRKALPGFNFWIQTCLFVENTQSSQQCESVS